VLLTRLESVHGALTDTPPLTSVWPFCRGYIGDEIILVRLNNVRYVRATVARYHWMESSGEYGGRHGIVQLYDGMLEITKLITLLDTLLMTSEYNYCSLHGLVFVFTHQ
jgi:hypothetical protein